ncbi:MAG TPA: hypothetical protein DIT63_01010 [Gammaproteobacteria bacterium]|nr:hypothetical protein [Gammaproteobacteria bacterium]
MTARAWISHVEWHCRDATAVSTFLGELFGWTFIHHGQRYRETSPEHGPRIGLLQVSDRPAGETQQAFIAIENLDEVLVRVPALGGAIAQTAVDIPDYGRYARIRAPDGTVLGLFEPVVSMSPT